MRLFRPKHTLESVLHTLILGLEDGTIVPEPVQARLFPELPQELAREIDRLKQSSKRKRLIDLNPSAVIYEILVSQAPAANFLEQIESLLEAVREVRRTQTHEAAQSLKWQMDLVARRVERHWQSPMAFVINDSAAKYLVPDGPHLAGLIEIVLSETLREQVFVVEELTIQLELKLAYFEIAILELAADFKSYETLLRRFVGDDNEARLALSFAVEQALNHAKQLRIKDVDRFVEALKMASIQIDDATRSRLRRSYPSNREDDLFS